MGRRSNARGFVALVCPEWLDGRLTRGRARGRQSTGQNRLPYHFLQHLLCHALAVANLSEGIVQLRLFFPQEAGCEGHMFGALVSKFGLGGANC